MKLVQQRERNTGTEKHVKQKPVVKREEKGKKGKEMENVLPWKIGMRERRERDNL